jgi:hypothetical protein
MLTGHLSLCVLLGGLIIGSGGLMAQASGHAATPSELVGASMAVLAMFQDADVLPVEGTPEADRIIKAVIQCQSVFIKGDDPAVQDFLRQALAAQRGSDAQEALSQFRSAGWTSNVLEALGNQWDATAIDQREKLAPGFRQFNISLEDFNLLMELVAKTRINLELRGQKMHQVFVQQRRKMPGGTQ